MRGMIETKKRISKGRGNSRENGKKWMAGKGNGTLEWTEDGVTREIKVFAAGGLKARRSLPYDSDLER